MAKLEIHQFPTRSDNYGVLIHDPKTEATASIDAPDAEELLAALHEKGWVLTQILTTHHHHDHTAGNTIVKRMTGCTIIGPAREAGSIPGLDVEVKDGDTIEIGGAKARVIETPGHTKGHVSYYFPEEKLVFVGDTLFSVGCGKLLEGDAKMMWTSLKKLMALPPDTKLYCGHEYTNNNCRFALTVEPENAALQQRAKEVDQLRAAGKPTLPTTIGIELETPFPRMTHAEAQSRYGSDKPDLRFGLEIEDATEATRASQFGVFANAKTVRFIRAPLAFSRAALDRLEAFAKEWGAKGLAYIVVAEDGETRSPIGKFLSDEELTAFRAEPGSTVLFAADEPAAVARVLGALRLHLGRELGLVDEDAWRFVWITDFPLFEWDEEARRWKAVHHPFTRPAPGSEELVVSDPGAAAAQAYDLVVNGIEIGGGSFRIHEQELQAQVFAALQLTEEEQRRKFGFLLDALAMGAPPHGGIAFGIERMLMALGREPNLRDMIAFPKNQAGVDPMSGAPSEVEEELLEELGIQLRAQPD